MGLFVHIESLSPPKCLLSTEKSVTPLTSDGFLTRSVRVFKDTQMKVRTKEEERKKDRKAIKSLLLLCPML